MIKQIVFTLIFEVKIIQNNNFFSVASELAFSCGRILWFGLLACDIMHHWLRCNHTDVREIFVYGNENIH